MSDTEAGAVDAPPPKLCEYAVEVTAARLARMLSHTDGVRKGEDAQPVHQMRVWSRRTRAALEIFEICFRGRAFAEIEREVKAATDALSEARDLDVMIENLQARAARLRLARRAGINSFIDRLKAQRDERQQAVAGAVAAVERHSLAEKFRELACGSAAGGHVSSDPTNGKAPRKAHRNVKRSQRHG